MGYSALFPFAMIGADGGQATFRQARQRAVPGRIHMGVTGTGIQPVQRLAPGAGYICDIGRTALAAFNFHGADAKLFQFREQIQSVQTHRLFNGVVHTALNFETAFAQSGVAGRFAFAISVDQYIVKTGLQTVRSFMPTYSLGWRAGTAGIGGFVREIGRQVAPALGHNAQTAECEDLQLVLGEKHFYYQKFL